MGNKRTGISGPGTFKSAIWIDLQEASMESTLTTMIVCLINAEMAMSFFSKLVIFGLLVQVLVFRTKILM